MNIKQFGVVILGLCVTQLSVAQSDKMPGYQEKLSGILQQVDKTIQKGPFHPTWDSLDHYQIPTWYLDAKFGIFIHWGIYSVPAYESEWYPRKMYLPGDDVYKHHIATFGPQAKFGYKDFIPNFTAKQFDPNSWAKLFHDSGAKFVVPRR